MIIEEYQRRNPKSRQLYDKASRLLPSGNSRTVLFFRPYPFYALKGRGSRIWDVDGNERIDYCFNYSVLILGHNHKQVKKAILHQLECGTCLGTPTEPEVKLAEKIVERLPCAERVRFAATGTESVMNALRLVRAYTKRKKIIKFEGAFHGTYDGVWTSVSPDVREVGPLTAPKTIPECEGVTPGSISDTIVLPFNNTEALEVAVRKNRDDLAGILVEPVLAVGGCIPPRKDFLQRIRELTEEVDSLLIFDEIVTGFRLAPGGAQELFGVTPDISTFGKVIGGGFGVGGMASTAEIMRPFEIPEAGRAPIPLSGTFNAHPVSMAAGLAVLEQLKPEVYEQMNKLGDELRGGIKELASANGLSVYVTGVGSLFHLFFTQGTVTDYRSAAKADKNLLHYFDIALINEGVFFPHLHWGNLSAATSHKDVQMTKEAIGRALDKLKLNVKIAA